MSGPPGLLRALRSVISCVRRVIKDLAEVIRELVGVISELRSAISWDGEGVSFLRRVISVTMARIRSLSESISCVQDAIS